jgi:DnaJ-domain-containing protein 1
MNKVHADRVDQIYRFWRRYLGKYHPDILKKINVETLTPDQITKKAKELLPKEYDNSK